MSRFHQETVGHSYLDIASNCIQTHQLNFKPRKKVPFVSPLLPPIATMSSSQPGFSTAGVLLRSLSTILVGCSHNFPMLEGFWGFFFFFALIQTSSSPICVGSLYCCWVFILYSLFYLKMWLSEHDIWCFKMYSSNWTPWRETYTENAPVLKCEVPLWWRMREIWGCLLSFELPPVKDFSII